MKGDFGSKFPVLLKNELGGNWEKEERAASPISRGSTLIAVMETSGLGEGN
jgi:hypothetical protein